MAKTDYKLVTIPRELITLNLPATPKLLLCGLYTFKRNHWTYESMMQLLKSSKSTVEKSIMQLEQVGVLVKLYEKTGLEHLPPPHSLPCYDWDSWHKVSTLPKQRDREFYSRGSAVYFLYDDTNELLYIGSTCNLKKRIKDHHEMGNFDYFTVLLSKSMDEPQIRFVEQCYMRKYETPNNTVDKTYSPGISYIEDDFYQIQLGDYKNEKI